MTHKQILEKAMRKAIDNGWQPNFDIKRHRLTIGFKIEKPFEASGTDWSVNDIIFNHDFAMALWGRECMACKNKVSHGHSPLLNECWQYHLQMMVISQDPLAYLGAHL